jgi:hypothetical protein
MQLITLLTALIASIIIFCVSPIHGLIIYIAAFTWYPTYLTVPIGTIDFTLRRIVILAIFAKLLLLTDLPKRIKFIWLDKIVIVYFAAQLIAGATNTTSLRAFLENRAGEIFDTLLPYFAVRMIIQNRRQYLTLLKGVLILAIPLVMVGFYECLTGRNPVGFMKEYFAWHTIWGPLQNSPWERAGFFRASVVFDHPIMYGLFFAMLGPVCAGLLAHVKKYRIPYWTGLGLMGIGVFSSMSSGSWLAALMAVSFILFYRWRKYWKVVLVTIVIMCSIVEIISNHHFYYVFCRFALSSRTAWYRSKLLDVALFEGGMSGHWLTGFSFGVDPGWGPKIDGLPYTDMVNQYLLVLAGYGLIGFIPFVAMNVIVIKNLVRAFKAVTSDSDKWSIWCLSGGLFGLAVAFVSVSIYGSPITIYYMMVGFVGAMSTISSPLREGRAHMSISHKGSSTFLLCTAHTQ